MDDLVPAGGDVLRRQRRAVVKLHALADLERVGQPVVGRLRHLGAQVAPEIGGRGRVARIDADQHAVERCRRVHARRRWFRGAHRDWARRRPGSCRSGRRRASAPLPWRLSRRRQGWRPTPTSVPIEIFRLGTERRNTVANLITRDLYVPSSSQGIVSSSSCMMQLLGCLGVAFPAEPSPHSVQRHGRRRLHDPLAQVRCGLEKCATSGGQRLPSAGDPVWSTAGAGPSTGFGLAAAAVGERVYELRENQAAPGVSNPHDVSPSSARRNASTCALLADRRRGGIRRAITDVLDSGKAATIASPPPLDRNLANWLPEAQWRNWRISYRPQGEGLLHSRAIETFIARDRMSAIDPDRCLYLSNHRSSNLQLL